MTKFLPKTGLGLYGLYLITKSTALITPVLYLFLEKDLGISLPSIIAIVGAYSIVGFILEIPTGLFSDSVGPRKSVRLGLLSMACSFLSFIFLDGILSLHIFLFLSVLANSLYSGADQALLRDLLGDKDVELYRESAYKLQGNMYLFTIPFLFIGVVLFNYSVSVLLLTQVSILILSLVTLSFISSEASEKKIKKKKILQKIKEISRGVISAVKNTRFIGLAIMSSAFGCAILINHRTIQKQIVETFQTNDMLALAIAFGVGNLASWYSSKVARKHIRGVKIVDKYLLTLILCMFLIYFFLSIDSGVVVISCFIILCIFKTIYRPLINNEVIRITWNKEQTASTFSAFVLLVSAISAGLQVAISFSFDSLVVGNIVTSITLTITGVIGLIIFLRKTDHVLLEEKSTLSGKVSKILLRNNEYVFEQLYPQRVTKEYFQHIEKMISYNIYNSPKLIDVNFKGRTIQWEAIRGVSLNSAINISENKIKELLRTSLRKDPKLENDSELMRSEDIFGDKFNVDIINYLNHEKWQGYIHGDLHPGNIISSNQKLYVVDWDLARYGLKWLDILSLILHPQLNLGIKKRIEILDTFFEGLTIDERKELFIGFCEYKGNQLLGFSNYSPEFKALSGKFIELSSEMRAYAL